MTALPIKHPLQLTILITAILGGVVLFLRNVHFLSTESAKICTGATLFLVMLYQAGLLLRKFCSEPIPSHAQSRHRKASYLAAGLFLLHLSSSAENWNTFLLITFALTCATAIFARSMVKPRSRNAVIWQVLSHTMFGAITIAAVIPHAIIALAFE